jgi:hypothetical protein
MTSLALHSRLPTAVVPSDLQRPVGAGHEPHVVVGEVRQRQPHRPKDFAQIRRRDGDLFLQNLVRDEDHVRFLPVYAVDVYAGEDEEDEVDDPAMCQYSTKNHTQDTRGRRGHSR